MTATEEPQVGDWWMCLACGECPRRADVVRSAGELVHTCSGPLSLAELDRTRPVFGRMRRLRLTEPDWLKCRNPRALLEMLGRLSHYASMPDWASLTGDGPCPTTEAEIRCRVGNPFRTVTMDPSWLTWRDGTVKRLAEAVLACDACDRLNSTIRCVNHDQLPILADALEEAGVTDDAVLRHLRQTGQHWPGCHVLRAVLD